MNLFQKLPTFPLNIIEDDSHIVQLGRVQTNQPNQLVYTVFDGILKYHNDLDAYSLDSKAGFIAWYRNILQVPKTLLEVQIPAGTLISTSKKIKNGLYEKEYLEFWLEYENQIIDSHIYLQQQDQTSKEKTLNLFGKQKEVKKKEAQIENLFDEQKEEEEMIVSKPIKMKGTTDNFKLVEREGELYINLKDLENMLVMKTNNEGVLCFSNKQGKKKEK